MAGVAMRWMLTDRTTCRECGQPMRPGEMVVHVLHKEYGGRDRGDYHDGECPKPQGSGVPLIPFGIGVVGKPVQDIVPCVVV